MLFENKSGEQCNLCDLFVPGSVRQRAASASSKSETASRLAPLTYKPVKIIYRKVIHRETKQIIYDRR